MSESRTAPLARVAIAAAFLLAAPGCVVDTVPPPVGHEHAADFGPGAEYAAAPWVDVEDLDDASPGALQVENPDAPCSPDASEPNDDPDSFTSIDGPMIDMTACSSDDDWFRISARAGDTISIRMVLDDDDAQVDFALYAPSGEFAGGSWGEWSGEATLELEAHEGGQWALMVYLADEEVSGEYYSLEVIVAPIFD